MNEKSCIGCKYLYSEGDGYSNYTWLETIMDCAKDRNKNLPIEQPSDWTEEPDNWPATQDSRCEWYEPGNRVNLDVEGDDGPEDYTSDEEAIIAICLHSGRGRKGGRHDPA